MSIEVNGVSLPDIPSEVLASYPYACIAYMKHATDASLSQYAALCGVEQIVYLNPDVTGAPIGYICPDNSSDGWTYALTDGAWVADEQTEEVLPMGDLTVLGGAGTCTLVWSNHDIYKADANFVATDELYFARNDSDPNYYAPKSWYDGMARQVMRLTGTSDKLNTGKMLAGLKSYEGGTSLAENERIYQVGTAASTLDMSGLLTSSAS